MVVGWMLEPSDKCFCQLELILGRRRSELAPVHRALADGNQPVGGGLFAGGLQADEQDGSNH